MAKEFIYTESGDISFIADTDLTAKQYYFVTAASTDFKVKLATGGSAPTPLGVLQNSPSAGQEARVRLHGTSKVLCRIGTCNMTAGVFGYCSSAGEFEVVQGATCLVNARFLGSSTSTAGSTYGTVLLFSGMWAGSAAAQI